MHRPHFFPFFGMGGYGSSDYGSSGYAEHPATIEQAAAYGLAKIIRAEADYQKESSLAAKNWADARKYELDNWKKWVETYYEVRRINREARAAERGRPMTEADYIRLAQIGKPRRLTPSEMDVVTGQLNWPLLLQATDFVAYRDMLDQVFSNRAYRGTMGLDDYVKAEQTAESMMDLLRGRIEEVRPAEYVVARRFLESLAYEARLPAPDDGRSADLRTTRR